MTRLDDIDLQIIRLLARDSRTSYKNIASAVGITSNASKERINKMVSNGVIDDFLVRIKQPSQKITCLDIEVE
jgi:Lrp/AsnC family transcriptional regulator, leucine-responsive regulatory protein